MSGITLRSIRIHGDDYCSQIRTLLPPIQTIEQGVEVIDKILTKEVFCWHDVQEINQIYQAVDLLERKIDKIPDFNSQHALQKIIEKVKRIVSQKSIKDFISLYHLQNFSDPELQIKQCFENLLSNFERTPEQVKAIAESLPYCFSQAQFDQDIAALIGPNPNEEVTKILGRKRKKLQDYEQTAQAIVHKRSELENLRKNDPQNYPAYLDELLDHGYIHLYDHLLQMKAFQSRNERRAEVEKITFSLLSHTVLEAREAIIQKVESSIPAEHRNILFLLGGSGTGKSTTLCFLRGDQMVLKDFNYESQSDQNRIIGLAGAISYTFLPTIEVVNDLVIVDFPGFEDSNGPIVSLGMECALKALIKKYKPKVLVLEAITNTEGRFANAAQLGLRLSRLLENKEDCLLGITKYSKDPDFGQIRTIEDQQKKERLDPSKEEITIRTQIDTLSGLKMPTLQSKIQELQQQLEKIEREKAQELQQALPETEEKKKSRIRIQEREDELLKQIGLGKIIRFDKLEDPSLLSSCLGTLSKHTEETSIRVNSQQLLDPEDEKLLEGRFKNNLVKEMGTQKVDDIDFKDFKTFEQKVLESSLISVIFSQSNQEIGKFLHLPEIDVRIVQKYDREIVCSCIEKLMKFVIGNLNISFIRKVLDEMKVTAPKSKIEALEQVSTRLRDYVMGLLGYPLPENTEQAEESWNGIQRERKAVTDAIEENFKLPTWATVCLYLPIGIPYGILTLIKWNKQNAATQQAIANLIDSCCNELNQVYETLVKLKDMEKIIEKQEAING